MKENRFNVNLRNPWWEEQRNEDEVIFSNIRISRIFLAERIEMSLQKNKHGDESRLWRQTKERRQIHAHYQQLSNCEMHFSVSATDRDADFMPPPPTPILMPFRNDLGAAQFQRSSMSSKVYHSKSINNPLPHIQGHQTTFWILPDYYSTVSQLPIFPNARLKRWFLYPS
jgi:hypothetical protein